LKDWATDWWYAKGTGYNWGTREYSTVAQDFTNMIWRSTTEVGFGISGRAVVALYCPKGNVRGRFACNVCPKGVGCSAEKCPVPNAVCSSTNGEGNAEISLRAEGQSIRIIATVKKDNIFSLALGSNSLVDSDLIVFYAKHTASLSFVKDSSATADNTTPLDSNYPAITESERVDEGKYIRFDISRKLNPGTADHFRLKKGTTHDLRWGLYAGDDFSKDSG
jgi:hypothetical protein